MKTRNFGFALALIAAVTANAAAQTDGNKEKEPTKKTAPAAASVTKQLKIQNIRPYDQRGINVFESPKSTPATFDGFKFDFGAAFTQQFQSLDHSNTAQAVMRTNATTGAQYNANQLSDIGGGFRSEEHTSELQSQSNLVCRLLLEKKKKKNKHKKRHPV